MAAPTKERSNSSRGTLSRCDDAIRVRRSIAAAFEILVTGFSLTLTGPRAQKRALALTELAARIRPSNAAERLRVVSFHTTDDRPWEAAAYLLSAFQATQMACFPRGGS